MIKEWEKFNELQNEEEIYVFDDQKRFEAFLRTYDYFKDIIKTERSKDSSYCLNLEDLDDLTEYEYLIVDWLFYGIEDLLDIEQYQKAIDICEEVMDLFDLEDNEINTIKSHISYSLRNIDVNKALEYDEKWYLENKDDELALVAYIYSNIANQKYDIAETLIKKHLDNFDICNEDNELYMIAAAKLYGEIGNKELFEHIKEKIEEYNAKIDEEIANFSIDSDDLVFF